MKRMTYLVVARDFLKKDNMMNKKSTHVRMMMMPRRVVVILPPWDVWVDFLLKDLDISKALGLK